MVFGCSGPNIGRSTAFAVEALHSQVLQLPTVRWLIDAVDAAIREQFFLFVCFRRYRKPQYQRDRVVVWKVCHWRAAAAILEVAILTTAGVIERPQSIGCIGRRWCRDPQFAKQRVADFEFQLAIAADPRGKLRKRIPRLETSHRCGRAARHIFASFEGSRDGATGHRLITRHRPSRSTRRCGDRKHCEQFLTETIFFCRGHCVWRLTGFRDTLTRQW
jgi:hypothetical protein